MIEVKRFSGALNTDDKPQDVVGNQHIDANNIRFTGGQNGLTAENIKGNYLINNANLPAGTNSCIGSFFDQLNQKIIWFNYNSNGDNGIYELDIATESVTPIFICGINSATDIFNFSLDYPVHSCSLVYREGGNLLYWTDGYNRPRYLNIDPAAIVALSPFTEDMINAGKNAPLSPPDLQYQDDINFQTNNLRKKLFRACYRWVYYNGDKSTFSPISKLPLPVNGYDVTTNNVPTYNNLIQISVKGGGDDYKEIEIAGQFNIGDAWGDFFEIDKLDRTEYNIPPNGTYNYKFYNDSAYVSIDPVEIDLLFSWLPDKANTLELLNGNTIIYGGITEGYDGLARSQVDVVITSSLTSSGGAVPTITYGYSGPRSIYIYIGPVVQVGAVYNVNFDYTYAIPFPINNSNDTYTTVLGDTQTSIASSLAILINNPGIITATATGGGYIFVTIATGVGTISNVVVTATATGGTVTPGKSWKWSCPGRLGLVYFDERGKTNGVISYVADNVLDNTDFAFYTPAFGTSGGVPQVPVVNASINHTPPTWAVSYQWVRASILPTNFIYWVTCDYQADSTYLYFGIQNLIEQSKKDSGFIRTYDFLEGDRIRVIAAYTGSAFVPYTSPGGQSFQQDMEILGIVTRPMGNPNAQTNGTYIKVNYPGAFPSISYQRNMLVEIYTPRQRNTSETEVFYEWGEKYDIYTLSNNRYHRGQIADQTASQPATFEWKEGDIYFKPRRFYDTVSNVALPNVNYFQDTNYSDYYASSVNSNGRRWIIEFNEKEEYNPTLVRWGQAYSQDNDVNELNIFYPTSVDTVDRSRGDIRRFKSRDRILRVFQDRGVGQYGVYARYIQNNSGDGNLVTTNDIITTNNVQYYSGVYGLCGYPTNLVSSQKADYFTDVVTGRSVRLAQDGLTDLGLLYKGQYYLSSLVTPYNGLITKVDGSRSKVMGFYDFFDDQYHIILEGQGQTCESYTVTKIASSILPTTVYYTDCNGNPDSYTLALEGDVFEFCALQGSVDITTGGGGALSLVDNGVGECGNPGPLPYNWSFNERRNAFCSFYDYHPEWATGADEMIYTWIGGNLWKHNNTASYCNFYTNPANASVTAVMNNNLLTKKSWNSLNEIATDVWEVPEMYTNSYSYGTQVQESNLVSAEFTILEGNPSSAIKRDINSPGGKINGNFMKGNYLVLKLQKTSAQSLVTLSEISVRFTESPLTAK